jgi:hypothetical protein
MLTHVCLQAHGVYLIDNGLLLLMWIGIPEGLIH